MARLLIADVTLLKGAEITAQVRFKGGTTHTLHLVIAQAVMAVETDPASGRCRDRSFAGRTH